MHQQKKLFLNGFFPKIKKEFVTDRSVHCASALAHVPTHSGQCADFVFT